MTNQADLHRHWRPRSQRRKKRRPGRGRQRGDRGNSTNNGRGTGTEHTEGGEVAVASAEEQPENAVEHSEGEHSEGGDDGATADNREEGAGGEPASLKESNDIIHGEGEERGGSSHNENVNGTDRKHPSFPSTPPEAGTVPSDSTASNPHPNLNADRFAGNMRRLPVFSGIATDSPAVEDDIKKVDTRPHWDDEGSVNEDNSAGFKKGSGVLVSDEVSGTEVDRHRDPEEVTGVTVPITENEASDNEEEGYRTQESSPHAPLLSPSDGGSFVADRSEQDIDVSQLHSAESSPEQSPAPLRRSRSLLSLPSFLPSLPRLPSLRSGSTAGAVANLCGATLGAGVLSLPFAISHAGLASGLSLLALAALSTIRSIDLLIKACDATGADGFEALTLRLCGPRVVWLVEGCIFIYCFGTAIAYIVAVGDMLQQGVIGTMGDRLPSFVDREFVMTLFWAAIMFPLSLSRRIDRLRYASIVGIGSVSFLVLAAVIHSVRDLASAGTPTSGDTGDVRLWASSLRDVFRACPIFIFAFSCQVNVCEIYHSLQGSNRTGAVGDDDGTNDESNSSDVPPKTSRMARVTRLGVLVCISLYVFMGLFGYIDFGKLTQDNVLKNYCIHDTRDPLMIFAFVCIAVTVVMAFPLNVLPARATLEGVLRRCRSRAVRNDEGSFCDNEEGGLGLGGGAEELAEPLLSDSASASGESDGNAIAVNDHGFGDVDDDLGFEVVHAPSDDELDGAAISPTSHPSQKSVADLKHALLTLLISGSALLTALVVPDISVVFGLMGGTASSLISFILPGTFALKVMLEEERSQSDEVDGGGHRGDLEANSGVGPRSGEHHDEKSKQWRRFEAWTLILGGAVIGVLSTAVTVHSIFYEDPIPSTCSGDDDIDRYL